MKKNLKGELASVLLAPALRTRFFELFGVASRKSVFAWQESMLPQAQVVVLDGSSDLARLLVRPPCVIWVGASLPPAGDISAWAGRLAQDYTIADLIDILDRAAVFLLDWQARHHSPAGLVVPSMALVDQGIQSAEPAVPASAATVTAQNTTYRLRAWVFLGAPFNSAGYINALALLTRQPVTVHQLQQHSGLNAAMVVDLLQELARRSVLQSSASAPVAASALASFRDTAPVRRGFVWSLSHWLKGASRP